MEGGEGRERKSHTKKEKYVQGPGGRKTPCAEILKAQLDWHVESEKQPGTACGPDHARLCSHDNNLFAFSLRSHKSRECYG